MSNTQQTHEELKHILHIVKRMELVINSLAKKARAAEEVVQLVLEANLFPNVKPQKGFRKKESK